MSAARPDLLLLSPEALSHAANAGIVKRAVRELAAGYRPRSSARVAAAEAAWIALVVADLETWCEAYAKRSALYDPV